MSGAITLNGNVTLQTFNNAITAVTKAASGFSGGITGTGNVLLNNLGLDDNTITLTTGAVNHTGSLTLQGTATGDTTIGSNIGANVTGVTQNSATSRLILSGTNTYTGATTISAGTLQIGAAGTTGRLSTSSAITNNGALVFNRSNAVTQGTDFASVIAGTGSVTQSGAGKLTLSGANTYTGATSVSAGTIAVNGSLANTSTTVSSGGTLQGSGSIGGSVTVQGGGIIAAGNSIESLTTGALTLEADSTFAYEINNDAAAGVAGDLTAVTGNLTLDLGNLSILTLGELGAGSWSIGEKLTLISYSGAWNGGLFSYSSSTLADDSNINFSGMEWSFNYNDAAAGTNYTGDLTGTSYVTMTAIPEPNTAALVGGLGMLALLRRRRN
jgi:autotransporter-associated beta strand protein